MKFKNTTPAYAKNDWQGVELYLQTWGDLPGRPGFGKRLMKLKKQDLADLCELALDATCRIELGDKHIKSIQNRIIELGLYPQPEGVKDDN